MKLSDLVARWLAEHGVSHVFGVSGGAVLHLFHSVNNHENLTLVPMQTEQDAGYAADAYARLAGIGVAMGTSGPGATSLLTAIASSYYDSVPCLYITGQVTTNRRAPKGVRFYGFQEAPIIEMVRPITKYCFEPLHTEGFLQKMDAMWAAMTSGRMGPGLVSLADDLQRAELTC